MFNTRNSCYHNKDNQAKGLEKIQTKLESQEITATVKQIAEKMTTLRTYYGAEKHKAETSKKSGAATADVNFSKWRFFESLSFLSDSFTPRATISDL